MKRYPFRKRGRGKQFAAIPLAVLPPVEEMGPALKALAPQYRVFVYELAVGPAGWGSLVRAARVAVLVKPGSSDETIQAYAGWALHRADVQEALKELGGKRLRIAAFTAMRSLEMIASDPEHPQCVTASKALLDRAFPIETHQHITVEKVDHTRQALDELRTLRRLEVPREKLVELYGADGLYHLEQQLDRPAGNNSMKLIEGTVHG